MDLLSLDDFKNTKTDPQWTAFDYLLKAVEVDQQKAAKGRYGSSSSEHLQCNGGESMRKKRSIHNVNWGQKTQILRQNREEHGVADRPQVNTVVRISYTRNRSGVLMVRVLNRGRGRVFGYFGFTVIVAVAGAIAAVAGAIAAVAGNSDDGEIVISRNGRRKFGFRDREETVLLGRQSASQSTFDPFSQVQSHAFLTESEAQHLEGKNNAITALLLEPSMVETEVNFNKWNMGKTSMYVIKTAWNSVVKNNGLRDTSVVRL
ncbi:Detected protein of unknown function [Hibiscus syriacus]|uniref:Uncharacterized protein n=1 Tax=Hibiscus syriacus TaxID=106335 RepID=A0A6A3CR99_HIBSY|nr:Detected protein of unknown function [Hibiscus syriacus]